MTATTRPIEEAAFDLAPISMWIEDFSGVRALFDQWRAEGVTDIRAFLEADLSRVAACSRSIRVLKVNARTLALYEARDLEHLTENLERVFRDDMLQSHVNELSQLWAGEQTFSSLAVNYTLGGRRLDIQLRGAVLPGSEESLERILLTCEDVTAREEARRLERASRRYAEGIFEHSPTSLWVEDFSQIRQLLENLRARGIVDLRVFTDVHPEFVRQCMGEIRVIDVNQATLDMFCAPDKRTLLSHLSDIFRDSMEPHFREQLIELWNHHYYHSREVVNYALDGTERAVIMHFAVLPGHEHDWSLVQVALTDITARKKAEAYLAYLGKHDVLTGVSNRAFYIDELNRLERQGVRPVSIVMLDLNGLKEVNDALGHDAGDQLLRRLGEVLKEAAAETNHPARIGGDEFAVVMPRSSEAMAQAMVDTIKRLLTVNNRFHFTAPLSVSIGHATSRPNETIEATIKRADRHMYEQKRKFYAEADQRGAPANRTAS
ncbi:sensor domain-containing diguanylate cyclase [Cereibacter johrii]|uniref:Diguanylate cyclase (GGDEF)-like protein n=1 Tax=Cereibacter johrii TaxID=445629 RepID=A0ABX5J848_9RHOB|nr:GGDEF domain-containing protein [Cereibacter johrii]ODM42789.1 histidine kinase [Cereibacter johrii]PTM78373.1 diguanylate cyclase (GGDEF)-like protein [Cereibacter johrii]